MVIGFEVIGLAILAFRDHRDRRTLLWRRSARSLLVGFQAWLGRETVRLGNSGESVTAHLASAMALVGLLVWILARSLLSRPGSAAAASQRFTLLAALGAGSVYALLLFGSHVTATSPVVRVPGLAADERLALPDADRRELGPRPPSLGRGHRRADRRGRLRRRVPAAAATTGRSLRLALVAAVLFPIQAIVGGLQILTDLSGWSQTLHLALGAIIWADAGRRSSRVLLLCTGRGRAVAAGSSGSDGGGRRRRGRATATRGAVPTSAGHGARLHRADEAADHRAAARHDRPGDGPRDARGARHPARPLGVADGLDARRRDARRRQRERDQLLPRPRHRRADDPDPAPAAAGPPGRPASGRSSSASSLGVDLVRRAGLVRQPRRGVPRPARDRVLRRRLHDHAEAHDAPEHRHRRRGRRAAAGHRLGGGHGQRRRSRRSSCSRSSSTGRRPTSGRCRSGSARTTPRPACRCCRSSAASPRRPARSACTRSSWSRSRSSSSRSPGWARSTSSRRSSSARCSCARRTCCGGAARPRRSRPPARSGSTSTRSRT